jgi:hypothetical protein
MMVNPTAIRGATAGVMQSSQHTVNEAGMLGSSGTEPGSSKKFTPHATKMRHSQTEPYRFQPQPQLLSGVVPVFSDSPLPTSQKTLDASDDESSPYFSNVTLTPSMKAASTDHGVHSYSRALPSTGFKEDAGLHENGWSG